MTESTKVRELSGPQSRILKEMQRRNYGTLEGVLMKNGDPLITDETIVNQTIKIGGNNGPRREHRLHNYELKSAQIQFLEELKAIPDGSLFDVVFSGGLPLFIQMRERCTG